MRLLTLEQYENNHLGDMTELYKNLCYSEGCYNKVEVYCNRHMEYSVLWTRVILTVLQYTL